MGKKLLLLAAVVIVTVLLGSPVFALDPLGPPTAGLKMMQTRAGLEYLFSKMDIKASKGRFKISGGPSEPIESFVMKPAEQNKVYGNLGLGMTDDWELFVRLGAANLSDKTSGVERDGDFGFSGGAGTKITFAKSEDGKLNWGALVQFTGTISDFETEVFSETIEGNTITGTDDADAKYYEFQFAVGPTYKLMDRVCIYGGPVLYILRGNLDEDVAAEINGTPAKATAGWDLEEKSILGGYIGAQIDLAPKTALDVEYQFGDKAWAVAVGIAWKN